VLAGARQGSNYPERLMDMAQRMGLAERVRLMLDVSSAQQVQLYQAADFFISPSDNIQETFGLTVLEALASGLPVLASDWDGYKDMVEHEVNGLLVPTHAGGDELLGELGLVSAALASGGGTRHCAGAWGTVFTSAAAVDGAGAEAKAGGSGPSDGTGQNLETCRETIPNPVG
jgi:hypothetical protein